MLVAMLGCSEYKVVHEPGATTATVDTGTPTTDTPTTPSTTTSTTTTPTTIATAPVYANTSDELFEIDPATGARTSVGRFHDGGGSVDGMVDIAIDLDGHLYGGTFDALYRIDAGSAAVTLVCATDLAPYALAFTSDGVLFAGAGTEIVEVDVDTCRETTLVSDGGYSTSGDLVGLPDGYLYWTVLDGSTDGLVRVNPQNGALLYVGSVGEAQLFGLGYDQGQLYGFSSNGSIVRIDPADGSTSLVFADTTSWWGATTNPVVW
jgi:hypothetical protein